jgi:hypothetical protein
MPSVHVLVQILRTYKYRQITSRIGLVTSTHPASLRNVTAPGAMICAECALMLQRTPTFRLVFPVRPVSLSDVEEGAKKLQCVICTQIYRASQDASSPFHSLRRPTADRGGGGEPRPAQFILSYVLEIGDKPNDWGIAGKSCHSREIAMHEMLITKSPRI